MLIGEGNENGKKPAIGLISKKNNFSRAAHFFVDFFAVALHDYNVKLPETSKLHVLWRKGRTFSCSLFFHCRYKTFMLFFQQKNVSFVFDLSL